MASPADNSAATQIRPLASQVRLRAFERIVGDRASDVDVAKGVSNHMLLMTPTATR
jgi:hypothetical protein